MKVQVLNEGKRFLARNDVVSIVHIGTKIILVCEEYSHTHTIESRAFDKLTIEVSYP